MRHLLIIIAAALVFVSATAYADEAGKWPGVDETVIEKVAQEHGREAGSGGLGLEGDAQLFAFLMAGVSGGFLLGYYFRKTFGGKCRRRDGGDIDG